MTLETSWLFKLIPILLRYFAFAKISKFVPHTEIRFTPIIRNKASFCGFRKNYRNFCQVITWIMDKLLALLGFLNEKFMRQKVNASQHDSLIHYSLGCRASLFAILKLANAVSKWFLKFKSERDICSSFFFKIL